MKFLSRIFLIIFAAAVFAACNGEAPPHWWDPSGKYSNLTPLPEQTPAPAVKKTTAAPQTAPAQTVVKPAQNTQEVETFTPVNSASVEVDELPVPSVLEN